MKAEEIREMKIVGEWDKSAEIEIAAQLAELNDTMRLILKTMQFYFEHFQENGINVTNHY